MKNEIILYRPNEAAEHIMVYIENEYIMQIKQYLK
jgi:hypothetical protein